MKMQCTCGNTDEWTAMTVDTSGIRANCARCGTANSMTATTTKHVVVRGSTRRRSR